jgi:ABC-type transport system involved in cytochrome bd biosynthesis fused ATPase/permease subunit
MYISQRCKISNFSQQDDAEVFPQDGAHVNSTPDMQIRPLEEAYKFGHFFSPLMTESDFEAKPSVLLLGQYSTGKTTFIKFLLGREDGYPGTVIVPAAMLLKCTAIHPSAAADSVQHP